MDGKYVVRCAQLAMLLEVSADPKPGNVDRCHDYPDTSYEDFVASAIGVHPVLRKAAADPSSGVGELIRMAVEESSRWHEGGNTHFGAFILLIPLVMAAGRCVSVDGLQDEVNKLVRETTVEDAVQLYRAFQATEVHVGAVVDLSVRDPHSIDKLKEEGRTLYDVLSISSKYDLISQEFVHGFENSFECARIISELRAEKKLNDAIVLAYMGLMARQPDTFIATKHSTEKAVEVSERAAQIVSENSMSSIAEFDQELIYEGINPGSTADIIIASLFIALLGGMKV